jgi:hypothetical protein
MKLEKPVTPQDYNKPKRQILGVDQLDDIGLALITLTREVAILNDRILSMEHVLEAKGIDISADLDALEPDEALQKKLDDATAKITGAVVGALSGAP